MFRFERETPTLLGREKERPAPTKEEYNRDKLEYNRDQLEYNIIMDLYRLIVFILVLCQIELYLRCPITCIFGCQSK